MPTLNFSTEEARDKYAVYIRETQKISEGQMTEAQRTVSVDEANKIMQSYCTDTTSSAAAVSTGTYLTPLDSAEQIAETDAKVVAKVMETRAGALESKVTARNVDTTGLTASARSVVIDTTQGNYGASATYSGGNTSSLGNTVTTDDTGAVTNLASRGVNPAAATGSQRATSAPTVLSMRNMPAGSEDYGIQFLEDARDTNTEDVYKEESVQSGEKVVDTTTMTATDVKSTSSITASSLSTLYQKNNARLVDFTYTDGSDDSSRRAYMQLQGEVAEIKELIAGDNASLLQAIYDHLIDKYTSIIIIRIDENLQEKQHVMPTVGDSFAATFAGAEPQLMNITGYLPFDGNVNNSWFLSFLNAYKIFIRASRLAKYRCNLKLVFPDFNTYTCYPVSINCGLSSDTDNLIMFSMTVLVTNNPINKAYGYTSSTTASTNAVESTKTAEDSTSKYIETGTSTDTSSIGEYNLNKSYADTLATSANDANTISLASITGGSSSSQASETATVSLSARSTRTYDDRTANVADADYGSGDSTSAALNLKVKRLAFITQPGNTGAIATDTILEYGVRDNQIKYLDNYLGKAYM